MKTSLSEIALIEAYLQDELRIEDRELVERRMIYNQSFVRKVNLQCLVYKLLDRYHKYTLKKALDRLHFQILNEKPNQLLSRRISEIFKT